MSIHKTEFLPVSLNITGKKILIIGAGKVALQKARSLSRFEVSISVLGTEIHPDFNQSDNIQIIKKEYEPEDLGGHYLIYACTNNPGINQKIKEDSYQRNILVSIADAPQTGDFVSPAIYKNENVTVAVGSNGKNPSKSVKIRNLIRDHLNIESDQIRIKKDAATTYNRNKDSPPLHQEIANKKGKVILAGFGPGDPGLLTLKSNQYLEEADFIFHDALLDVSYLDRFKAQKIPVGKRCGQHYKKQEEINEMLLEAAFTGKNVVRLKGGDPFVFGRGGEEVAFLNQHQVDVEVIPGITSAFAAAAQFGIPLTQREVSSSLAFLVGHNLSTRPFPKADTLVFYMGAKHQCELSQALIEEGWDKSTPVALLSNISNTSSKAVITQLDKLCKEKGAIETPLLIIVGETIRSISDLTESAPEKAAKKAGEPVSL
ncbi:uroporphyrinogen-III C-methyltransferase [Marinilabilia rubra]|uniref:Uroporphyrinogen-III C-methyltransferase n=1 Tax=Marinilabilia rubra TaxID=2162893 RepID=A0A2U2B4R8_9BACT|nr:uroporphyrinogen-III C-methyltransferase [Marinilabilia rubra]PWD98055.1 uroporphyrinogen-III C-methyltransferase [Marinilabilia rubra]